MLLQERRVGRQQAGQPRLYDCCKYCIMKCAVNLKCVRVVM